MTTALFVAALAVIGAYVCRLDSLDRRRDPLWYMGVTYLLFLAAVDAAHALATGIDKATIPLLVASSGWITWTYFKPLNLCRQGVPHADRPRPH